MSRIIILLFFFSFSFIDTGHAQVANLFIEVDVDKNEEEMIRYGHITYNEDFRARKIYWADDIDEDHFVDSVRTQLALLDPAKRNILLYIHGMKGDSWGFLGDSHEVMQREMWSHDQHQYGLFMTIIWKCGTTYHGNVDDALHTGKKIAPLVHRIHNESESISDKTKISYLVFSMGNRVFQGIWADELEHNERCSIHQLIMTGADLETNIFEPGQTYEYIDRLAERVLVYRHNNDRTLGFSKAFNGQGRLGLQGIADLNKVSPKIIQVDVSLIDDNEDLSSSFTNHRYFYMSPTVRRDLFLTLNGEYTPDLLPRRKRLGHDRRYLLEKVSAEMK